jgi:hypothetical protein
MKTTNSELANARERASAFFLHLSSIFFCISFRVVFSKRETEEKALLERARAPMFGDDAVRLSVNIL